MRTEKSRFNRKIKNLERKINKILNKKKPTDDDLHRLNSYYNELDMFKVYQEEVYGGEDD